MLQLVQNILNEIHFGDEEKIVDDVPGGGTDLLVYSEINVRKLLNCALSSLLGLLANC